jgi:hypothetical protein
MSSSDTPSDRSVSVDPDGALAALYAERDRLREALHRIAEQTPSELTEPPRVDVWMIHNIAKEALDAR